MSVREYKDFKNLKKENLRDNMTNIEYSFLITTFAGLSTMLGAILIFFKVGQLASFS